MLPFCFMGKHDVHTMYSPPNKVSVLQDLSFKKKKEKKTLSWHYWLRVICLFKELQNYTVVVAMVTMII